MKAIIKQTGKFFLWILTSIVVLIVLLCTIFTIPAVQTYVAQKAAAFLSDKMQAEVSIGKLRIDFGLKIQIEQIRINDLYGNNLISARRGSLNFPSFNTAAANVEIRNIVLDSADVTLRRYENDTALNLQFFVDFLRPKEKKNTVIDLQQVELKNSRFQFRNDATAGNDLKEVWNYSNMIIEDINIKCRQIFIVGDSLNFYIDRLTARERSGFQVDEFSGHLIVCRTGIHCLETDILTKNQSQLNLDFRFDYTDFPDFQDFVHKIVFNTDLFQARLNLADLFYFVPAFKGMNGSVNLTTSVKGTIDDLKIENLDLSYGQATKIEANVNLTGLPLINETMIDADIKNLKTNIVDLAAFSLPKHKQIPLPEIVKKNNYVELQGHFSGLYDNFLVDADINTALGNVSCELLFDNRSIPASYDLKVQTKALDLGSLINNKNLGNIDMQGRVMGEGFNLDDFNFQFNSTVANITFRNNTVRDVFISGEFLSKQFKAQIGCEDKDFNLDFDGFIDFAQPEPHYKFDANVYAINLSNFHLFRPDSNAIFSARVDMDITGKDVEHFQGHVNMDNIIYKENHIEYVLPAIALNVEQENYPAKKIRFKSDILKIDLAGKFNYRQAFAAVQKNLHIQLPKLINFPANVDSTMKIFPQQFDLSVKVTDSIPVLDHFLPQVRFEHGLSLDLSIDQSKSSSYISVEVPQLDVMGKHRINNLSLVNDQDAKVARLEITCQSYLRKGRDTLPDLQDFAFEAIVANNVVDFLATATGNQNNKIHDVLVEGSVAFLNVKKLELEVVLNNGSIAWDDDIFLFDAFNRAYLSRDSIFITNFGLHSQLGKSLMVESNPKGNRGDGIYFNFNKIDLAILNVWLNRYQISLNGTATGRGEVVHNAYGYAVGSDVDVDDFQFNGVAMGYFQGNTAWDNIERKLFIEANLFQAKDRLDNDLLTISGSFDPRNKFIDLTGKIDSLNIKILEPYLKSFASKVEGFGTGELTFKGQISKPVFEGMVLLKNATLGIDFLQTNYFIDRGVIRFVDTGFIFENIPFHDAYNGNGFVNGIVTHNRLRNFGVDLKVDATNLSVLNTTLMNNNLFYGKAFVTGNASIFGNVSAGISIDAGVTTNPFTDITLSLDWNTTAVESDFITFVSFQTRKKEDTLSFVAVESAAMDVNLRITATSDAIVRVLLDPSIGGTITSRGGGTIDLILDKNDDFSLYGVYTISGGEFDLAFGDVLTRTFKIESGGTISWNGDPMLGVMSVRAIQATKVSINNLFENEATTKLRPISVNNILSLNGRLLNPDFSFSFELPDADEITRSKIYSEIDTSNREDMIGQVVNVLLFGTFKITAANQEVAAGVSNNQIGYSISEIISSQLKKVVSSLSPNLDVRMGYIPGESAEGNEYSVDVGGSFLNNKLTVSTSLGILEQQDMNRQDRFLGDVTVEYKLISDGSLRVSAFNISNPQDVIVSTSSSTYSQGMGLSYLKDFDKFKDLFIRKPRKKKKTTDTKRDVLH
jgi:hypothetical protein